MLIRSQDRKTIFPLRNLTIDTDKNNQFLVGDYPYTYGVYSTEEKAIKVLDMISAEYNAPILLQETDNGEYYLYNHEIFQMPLDSEVE